MDLMYRYTTPKVAIVFPISVNPTDIVEFWMTISQKGTVKINKTKSAFTQDPVYAQRFYTVLSETETASLDDKEDAYIQVRANVSGTSVASRKKVFDVEGVLKEGNILP